MPVDALLHVMAADAATAVQLHQVQGPAGVVFAAAFFLAAWQPEGAWRRGAMIGLAVPFAHLIALLTGRSLPYQVDPPAITMLALVPAMIGTMVGVRVSRLRSGASGPR
jgi:NO-binding membrane sensor protein with MHYT domain